MRDVLLFFPVFLGLVGCAGTSEIPMDRGRADAFYTLATVADVAPDAAEILTLADTLYEIETRLVDGGCLAVLLTVTPVGDQRRVASQTQATMKRQPEVSAR